METFKASFLASILVSVSGLIASQAAADECTGKVTEVGIHRDGSLLLSTTGGTVSFNRTYVCNTAVTPGGSGPQFTPKACEALHSDLLAAQLSGRPMSFYFPGACPPFPSAGIDNTATASQSTRLYQAVIR